MKTETEKVNEFMQQFNHPLQQEMDAVREIIMNANANIGEHIKWGMPSFFYKNDMATFAPKAKKYIQIVFHKGALIDDGSGLLEGDHPERRDAKFHNMEDVRAKKAGLEKVINDWVKIMNQ